jgi:hypothetical protein
MASKMAGGAGETTHRESLIRILQKKDLEYQARIKEIQAKRKQLRISLRDFEAGRLSASEFGSSLRW